MIRASFCIDDATVAAKMDADPQPHAVPCGAVVIGIEKEVDPTVPDWAKQPAKPVYTPTEVGAEAITNIELEAMLR